MRRLAPALALVLALAPRTGLAQDVRVDAPRDSVEARTPAPDGPVRPEGPTPGGAFLRSLIVPGWGQAAYDANLRGAVFFGAQTGSWFMLVKSIARLGEARDMEARRVEAVGGMIRDSLLLAAQEDEELAERYQNDPLDLERDIAVGVDEHESVQGIRSLVDARRQQREDWIALTLFITLASGVDAFVNAHLSDFPGQVVAEPRADGGFSMGLKVPVSRDR